MYLHGCQGRIAALKGHVWRYAALEGGWQPQWMSGGYAQAGLTRSYPGSIAPNMVVGGIIGNEVFLDANIGIAASLGGSWWLASDIALGMKF